jgi:small subunit ribosomal protein S17
MSETSQKTFKRKLNGTVVSDASTQTIVVKVNRRFKHPLYGKFVNKSKKYHAHDANNTAKVGDTVTIIESKPYSKLKKWELVSVN